MGGALQRQGTSLLDALNADGTINVARFAKRNRILFEGEESERDEAEAHDAAAAATRRAVDAQAARRPPQKRRRRRGRRGVLFRFNPATREMDRLGPEDSTWYGMYVAGSPRCD